MLLLASQAALLLIFSAAEKFSLQFKAGCDTMVLWDSGGRFIWLPSRRKRCDKPTCFLPQFSDLRLKLHA
jgi:hypothetical protein